MVLSGATVLEEHPGTALVTLEGGWEGVDRVFSLPVF